MPLAITLMVLNIATAMSAVAVTKGEVVKSNEFQVPSVTAKGVKSAMLALPDGTILALVVSPNADWRLYRIRDWLGTQPSWDSISISAAFLSSVQHNLRDLRPRLLKTFNPRFALCVIEADFYETRFLRVTRVSSETAISVVDLQTFEPVTNVKLGALKAENFYLNRIDQEDRLLIEKNRNVDGIPTSTVFFRLTIPSLSPGPMCQIQWVWDASARKFQPAEAGDECKLATPKGTTLDEYIKQRKPQFASELSFCKGNPARFCGPGSVASLTADGAFAISEFSAGRDAFPIGYTWTYHSYLVFSCHNRSDIGEIKVPPHADVHAELVSKNGRDYLVVMERGSRFTVYELRS